MTQYDVVGVGNAIVDILSRVEDAVLDAVELPKGIMSLVELDKSKSIYTHLGPSTERSGGSVANSIAALGALGRRAGYIGKVNADQFGEVFAHDIRAQGVAFDASKGAGEAEETARSMIMVTPDAERTMATYLGVATDLGPDDIDAEMVAESQILYLEGYLWDKPAAKDAFRRAMQIAHDNGRRVALSLSDPFCVERHRDSFREIVKGEVDILFANEDEICSLYQTSDVAQAADQAAGEVAVSAITRSERGALIVASGARAEVPASAISELVDTTGAGDLFAAGFLNGVVTGQSPEICGQMGCAAAGVVIQRLGARCGDELKACWAEQGWA